MTIAIVGDYNVETNQTTHSAITSAFNDFKRYWTARSWRIKYAEELTDLYFELHGKMPPSSILDRLATLILQDELADKDLYKMKRHEYPLLSARQQERRHGDERSMKAAQDVATDGVDYRIKTRDSNRRMREIFD